MKKALLLITMIGLVSFKAPVQNSVFKGAPHIKNSFSVEVLPHQCSVY